MPKEEIKQKEKDIIIIEPKQLPDVEEVLLEAHSR